ncbi:MAG: hypothetical protein QG597_1116, partial [Actinomycetota bacterium]|nr:hypothetical protein [Actinomycetota bacterium]
MTGIMIVPSGPPDVGPPPGPTRARLL